ncbi:phosphotransferase [Tsukamurella sp. 8F]|uniref:phosphotransferase enzyme family protein n=1 Tax=unclassified Tsukamurella TaxID=2633480 RepID=UPI0023B9A5F8|nr:MULTISPECIES: phosphotransferase [unclassified Tsukamurella]MDF0530287.1 phosphotransferase [Tsukamurella sp. 8J]MDF0588605.1 phosphotransferase [Tsukamurella sp. 8F]
MIDGDEDVAAEMLAAVWPEARAELLMLSENATFRVVGGPRPAVLRVHRAGYQSRDTVGSELDWLAALASVSGLSVVEPLVVDGIRILSTVDGAGRERLGVLFAELDGEPVDVTGFAGGHFGELGRIAAQLHEHVAGWRRPPGFARFSWGLEETLGVSARWGDWRRGPGMTPGLRQTVERAGELVARRLSDFGTGPDRYGLIHADLRASNLMPGAHGFTVIDFDDCGFGWYLYDFAASVSFVETDPELGDWAQAWLDGYRSVLALSSAQAELLPTLVMLRRLQLTAWLGGHDHAAEAADAGFASGTAELASRYVALDAGRLW